MNKKLVFFALFGILILGLILFSIAIIGTMISMKYEIIDPQDCISILTGKNLCLTMQILKVLIVLCILSLSLLVIFEKGFY